MGASQFGCECFSKDKDAQDGLPRRPRAITMPDNDGTTPESFYNIPVGSPAKKAHLGKGAFGSVQRVTKKGSGDERAMKTIIRSSLKGKQLETFENECRIQRSLDHPNIVRLFETFKDARSVFILLEICDGGELFTAIEASLQPGATGFTEFDIAHVMLQITKALVYIHSNSVAHRDVKPENYLLKHKGVVISQNTVKLSDFGAARHFTRSWGGGTDMTTKVGSFTYMAPEVLKGCYTEKVDVWSAGVILYILLCGRPPFDSRSAEKLEKSIKQGLRFPPDDFENRTDEAKVLIKNMCQVQLSQRFCARAALEQPWMQQASTRQPLHEMMVSPSSKRFVHRLREFRAHHHFKKASLNLAVHFLDDRHIAKLRHSFEAIDKNHDGQLTLAEMMEACKELGVDDPSEVKDLFEHLDADGSGQISYKEFLAGMVVANETLEKEHLWEAFRSIDQDGNGRLGFDEVRDFLADGSGKDMKGTKSNDDILTVFQSMDKDNDGSIDFDEFCEMLKN